MPVPTQVYFRQERTIRFPVSQNDSVNSFSTLWRAHGTSSHKRGPVQSHARFAGHRLVIYCALFRLHSAEGDDEDDEDDDNYEEGDVNIGKAFLIPRAKMGLYDHDIFSPEAIEARDKVGRPS